MTKLENIKIIFIDIDGTLVNSRRRITVKTRKSIKRIVDKGIIVVLCSGRNYLSCVNESKNALASEIVIASNGAQIYNYKRKEFLYISEIPKNKLELIWNYCDDKQIGIIFNSNQKRLINKYLIGSFSENYEFITDFSELQDIIISQFILVSKDYDKLSYARDFILSLDLAIGNFSSSFLKQDTKGFLTVDVINKNISKGSGVLKLLEILEISSNNSLCFGDFVNDLDMFRVCKFSVAMGNACDEIKKNANFITYSNDNNGVAYFLDKYL